MTEKIDNKPLRACDLRIRALRSRWIIGTGLGFLLALLIGGHFLDSYPPWEWSEELGKDIYPQGSVVHWRTEGWATTRFGKWGISGIADVDLIEDHRVLIWGDSFVEAFQVNDAEKMPQVVTRKLMESGIISTRAMGIGVSGASSADYYFSMKPYERVCGPVMAHVFIVSDLEDYLPDEPSQRLARFISQPEFELVPPATRSKPRMARILRRIHQGRLQAMKVLFADITGAGGTSRLPIWRRIDFRLGPRSRNQPELSVSAATKTEREATESFDYILGRLQSQTSAPMLFVYCPNVPRMESGVLQRRDNNHHLAAIFRAACERHGIVFVDASTPFINQYERDGTFPRGFPNTRPGVGHLNAHGHSLVGELIAQSLMTQELPWSSIK